MTVWRRFLVLAALIFWQGGFTFYGAVVVPIGRDVLGSHLNQGLITQRVTHALNVAGAVALPLWAWELAAAGRRGPMPWRRWGLWLVMAGALGVLVGLHPYLDDLIDADAGRLLDKRQFRALHRWYLNVSTVQWAASLCLLFATLRAWRAEDRHPTAGERVATAP